MHSRKGDMCCVGHGFPGEDAGSQDCGRKVLDFGRDIEQGEVLNDQHPLPRCVRVSASGLIKNQLRNVYLEGVPSPLPPFLGDLLMAGNNQIPAGPRSEIARNSCFHVKSLFHFDAMLSLI